jgi:hypothetical protein
MKYFQFLRPVACLYIEKVLTWWYSYFGTSCERHPASSGEGIGSDVGLDQAATGTYDKNCQRKRSRARGKTVMSMISIAGARKI